MKRLIANLDKPEYVHLAVKVVELADTYAVPLAVKPRDLCLHNGNRVNLFEHI
jgi:hypothetical protein